MINVNSYRHVYAKILRSVEQGRLRDTIDRTFEMEQIVDAHRYMEANMATGKVVVLTPAF